MPSREFSESAIDKSIRLYNFEDDLEDVRDRTSKHRATMASSELFGVHNLPFGIASSPRHSNPQCVTRLDDTVIFLAGVAEATRTGSRIMLLIEV